MASNVRITGQIIKFSRTSLAPTSSIRTGGIATHYVRPESFTALREVLRYAAEHALSCRAIGALTNTLVSDQGVDEIVIDTRSLNQVRIQGSLLIAQSGAAMDQVIETAIDAGLGGLEELAGLPGTVGGAVFGNSGANGKSVADLLYWTEYLDSEAKLYRTPVHRSAFGYRHSPFVQHSDHLITEVAFALTPIAQKSEAMRRKEGYKAARNKKGHFSYPSLGSIFKNPSKEQSAGALIESLGLKGTSIGGASISETHANFIINPHRTATSSDVQALIALIKEQVAAATGILLEEEINYLGRW